MPKQLRNFLEQIRSGSQPHAIPPLLFKLAASVVRRAPQKDEGSVDDLTGSFLVAMVARARGRGPEALDGAIAATDAAMCSYVKTWLKRLAIDGDVLASEAHALRPHVKRALDATPPGSAPPMPPRIAERGRFRYPLVRDAVHHLLGDGQARRVEVMTRILLARYFDTVSLEEDRTPGEGRQRPSWTHREWRSPDPEPAEHLRLEIDGRRMAEQIVDFLGHEDALIVALKAHGETDARIGKLLGLSLQRVNERYHKSLRKLKTWVAEAFGTERTFRTSVRLLAGVLLGRGRPPSEIVKALEILRAETAGQDTP